MTAAELDVLVKLVIGIIGAGSGIVTWFARTAFTEMKKSLDSVLDAVNLSRVTTAVLEKQASDFERRIGSVEHRVSALESEARQIREG